MRTLALLSMAGVLAGQALAQTPAPARHEVRLNATSRVRYEQWNWFEPAASAADNSYGFLAARTNLVLNYRAPRWLDARVDLQNSTLLGLPDDATAAPPAGDLGLGATYFAQHQERDISRVFLNQAYVTLRASRPETFLRLGRMEYLDGLEVMSGDPTIDWLKRVRLSARLIGTFAFSHGGRSFDGGQASVTRGPVNATALLLYPRQGGFELEGMDRIGEVSIGGGSLTLKPGALLDRTDVRLFFYGYRDSRNAADTVTKVDNRPAPARAADGEDIGISMFGGHIARAMKLGGGDADLMLWGTAQTGEWGMLRHRAWAVAAEAGYQPRAPWRPWIRAGYFQGSGDDDAGDGTHRTFFPALTTVRQYAQFPFFNAMNTKELFLQAILRPVPGKLSLRTDLRKLELAEAADLWYAGSGAFRRRGNFGYGGRPSNGETQLATLVDLGVTWDPSALATFHVYAGHAFAGEVVQAIYPDRSGQFGYAEVTLKF